MRGLLYCLVKKHGVEGLVKVGILLFIATFVAAAITIPIVLLLGWA